MDTQERERRGVPLSVRISKTIHDEIAARAKADDKSVTQTVERLLEYALTDQRRTVNSLAFAYGEQTARLLLQIGAAVRNVSVVGNFITGTACDDDLGAWLQNPFIFQEAATAIEVLVERLRPGGDVTFENNIASDAPEFRELPEAGRRIGSRSAKRIAELTERWPLGEWFEREAAQGRRK